ncbi:GNAT family N-acetyltransferase [Psychrobacillus lasiicapitis]|uniref:GNAT family N-acetyltransferase n=1 Tax=Psychrobacillus lasiicapitis TaxID=1636719 RepID=A0A544SRH4_9BACI|nr:GNAT family N-acetyltransferase [Psychrobacillus lasiicapitis]TQR07806.1 GNAT family N-acetyltransferase [Psychrobacillus lasiicapitis]GGA48831.1 N-acetyltransferase [Psychrobacillus lasiicapitis]
MSDLFTIDCGEILLREFRREDVDAIYDLTSQPEVYEFLPDWRSTREQRLDWVTNYEIPANKEFLANVPSVGEGWLKLGIILKETDEFIGFCNTGIKEELSGPNREVAYSISKYYRSIGYATLAVKALVNYLFENTDVEQLNAVVLPRNIASNKVIRKCGFQLKGKVEIEDQLHSHYIISRFPKIIN